MNRVRPTSHPVAARKPIHRSLATSLSLAVLAICSLCNAAEATLLYNFEQEGTGTVLATLELDFLPASHSQVVSLDLTTEGTSIFSFFTPYAGSFDTSVGTFIADGLGGLEGSGDFAIATLVDNDPAIIDAVAFTLAADDNIRRDQIEIYFGPDSSPISEFGDWVGVPEPSTLTLATLALLGMSYRRRRRA
jgi:hypothetical protein